MMKFRKKSVCQSMQHMALELLLAQNAHVLGLILAARADPQEAGLGPRVSLEYRQPSEQCVLRCVLQ